MIEFNLLPDVKLDYIKVERTKKQVFSISIIVAAVSVGILVLLFLALELQNHQISDNNKDIKKYSAQLTGTTDINKVLTIQNQLKSVVSLYNSTPVVTRLYSYIPQLVPANVSISHLTVDFGQNTMRITGSAPSLETVNTFADTLKFATYTTDTNPKGTNAFTSVQLSSFSRDSDHASYDFSTVFDPVLFDRSQNVTLHVPAEISTRSFTQLPSDNLFKTLPPKTGGN